MIQTPHQINYRATEYHFLIHLVQVYSFLFITCPLQSKLSPGAWQKALFYRFHDKHWLSCWVKGPLKVKRRVPAFVITAADQNYYASISKGLKSGLSPVLSCVTGVIYLVDLAFDTFADIRLYVWMGSCRLQRETRALTSLAVMFCLCSFLLHSGPKGGFFFFFKTVITSSKQRRHPGHHCSRQPRQATLVLSLKESFYLWDISLTLCNDTWSTTCVTSLITGSFFYSPALFFIFVHSL